MRVEIRQSNLNIIKDRGERRLYTSNKFDNEYKCVRVRVRFREYKCESRCMTIK